jgi:hypothetical protein
MEPTEGKWRRSQDWFWEGNVQERVLDYMQAEEGFTILSPGMPSAREHGIDIVAERTVNSVRVHRLVNIWGWPASEQSEALSRPPFNDYAARPEAIARDWMAQAIFDIALNRGSDPDLELSLGLPTMAGYIRYLQRLRWFLASARISVYLVSQDGRVTVMAPGAAPVGALAPVAPSTQDVPAVSARRKLGLPGASRVQLPLLHVLQQLGGKASRTECISMVANWFPEVSQPPPTEFGQRVSIAQSTLQIEGLTEITERGTWAITDAGRAAHDAEWANWTKRNERETTE